MTYVLYLILGAIGLGTIIIIPSLLVAFIYCIPYCLYFGTRSKAKKLSEYLKGATHFYFDLIRLRKPTLR